MRKVIEFDDETWHALMQLGRDRMGDLQELADEAFADLLVKHGVPKNLKDALRKSVAMSGKRSAKKTAKQAGAEKRAPSTDAHKKRASRTRSR